MRDIDSIIGWSFFSESWYDVTNEKVENWASNTQRYSDATRERIIESFANISQSAPAIKPTTDNKDLTQQERLAIIFRS